LKDTAYYDLWRFDPSKANWQRVICTRTPNPKGGALLLAYEAENTLILSGGNRGYITNMNQRVPIHYDSLHRHDDLSYFTFTYKSRNTDNPTGEWNDLLLRHRPLSRLNAAGCILNELKIMIVDGGSGTQVRDEEDPDQLSTNTFVLDMEKYSPKSWIWSSKVEIGGFELPDSRSLHHCCPVSSDAFVMSALGEGINFVHCDVKVYSSNIEIGQMHRSFSLFFTKINISIPKPLQMPHYLEGARLQASGNVLYWLSPVSKGMPYPWGNAMSLFRMRLDSDTEATLLENSLPLLLNSSDYATCLLGYALGRLPTGFIVFGGAVISDQFQNAWADKLNITSKPDTSNEMFFLQII